MGLAFVTVFDLLSSVPEIFRATKLKWVSCYSQQAPLRHHWVYANEVTVGKASVGGGWLSGNQPGREGWNFPSYARFLGRGEGLDAVSHQRPMI